MVIARIFLSCILNRIIQNYSLMALLSFYSFNEDPNTIYQIKLQNKTLFLRVLVFAIARV